MVAKKQAAMAKEKGKSGEMKSLERRVSRLEEFHREAPQRPEDAVREARPGEQPSFLRERASARDHETPVREMMQRLQGR